MGFLKNNDPNTRYRALHMKPLYVIQQALDICKLYKDWIHGILDRQLEVSTSSVEEDPSESSPESIDTVDSWTIQARERNHRMQLLLHAEAKSKQDRQPQPHQAQPENPEEEKASEAGGEFDLEF